MEITTNNIEKKDGRKTKQTEPRGRKFNVNSCKTYERKAFRFIQAQYPQYDVEKEFHENLRILDSELSKGGTKLGTYMTKFKQITMFVKRIEAHKNYTMYSRSSAHLMPKAGMVIDNDLHLTLVMVHEMTHAMQHAEGTILNEVDTTRNEIEYLRTNHTDLYLDLVPSQTKPLFRRKQRLALTDKSVMEVGNVRWKTKKREWLYHLIDTDGNKTKVWESDVAPEVLTIYKPRGKRKEQVVG